MQRSDFISYIESQGCTVVRTDRKGYSIVRNVINAKQSGVPFNDPLLDATVCRICKTLEIEPPDEAISAKEIIELAHKKHGNGD